MFSYVLFGLSLAAAAVLLIIGIRQHMPPVTTDAAAEQCCWAPKGRDTRCYPCRPTRETR